MCFTRASGEQTCTLAASTALELSPATGAIHHPLQHPSKAHPCTPPSHPLPTQPFPCHLLFLGRDHIPAQEEPAGMCTAGLGCHPTVRGRTFSIRSVSDRRTALAGEADRVGWWPLCVRAAFTSPVPVCKAEGCLASGLCLCWSYPASPWSLCCDVLPTTGSTGVIEKWK